MTRTATETTFWIAQCKSLDRYYQTLDRTERDAIDESVERALQPLRDCLEAGVGPGNGLEKVLIRERYSLRVQDVARRVFDHRWE